MKRFFKILFITFSIVLLCSLIGCSTHNASYHGGYDDSDEEYIEDTLVGNWVCENHEEDYNYHYPKQMVLGDNGVGLLDGYSCTWTEEDSTLICDADAPALDIPEFDYEFSDHYLYLDDFKYRKVSVDEEEEYLGTWICQEERYSYPDEMTIRSNGIIVLDDIDCNWYIEDGKIYISVGLPFMEVPDFDCSVSGDTLYLNDCEYIRE